MTEPTPVPAERSDLNGFQIKDLLDFDRISEETRRLKRKSIPDYRRISVYYKSSRQYWKERSRRKQVLQLLNGGLDIGEIARQLGVNQKTIYRDLRKLERYIRGQINRKKYLLQQEEQKILEESLPPALSPAERYKRLIKLLFRARKLSKREECQRHNITVFFDMDNLKDGFPSILMEDKTSLFQTPYNITLAAKKEGQIHTLGRIRIG
jgi:DNA-binding CsgD family transcriptional regulator